jgi:hypothetical protein
MKLSSSTKSKSCSKTKSKVKVSNQATQILSCNTSSTKDLKKINQPKSLVKLESNNVKAKTLTSPDSRDIRKKKDSSSNYTQKVNNTHSANNHINLNSIKNSIVEQAEMANQSKSISKYSVKNSNLSKPVTALYTPRDVTNNNFTSKLKNKTSNILSSTNKSIMIHSNNTAKGSKLQTKRETSPSLAVEKTKSVNLKATTTEPSRRQSKNRVVKSAVLEHKKIDKEKSSKIFTEIDIDDISNIQNFRLNTQICSTKNCDNGKSITDRLLNIKERTGNIINTYYKLVTSLTSNDN